MAPTALISSAIDAVQLLTGSGEVLMTIRLPDLTRCEVAATLPPTIAAASIMAGSASPTAPAASIAPAGKRIKVCSVSQTVSTPGILSAPNSTIYIRPAAPITNGFSRMASSAGRAILPDAPPRPKTSSTA